MANLLPILGALGLGPNGKGLDQLLEKFINAGNDDCRRKLRLVTLILAEMDADGNVDGRRLIDKLLGGGDSDHSSSEEYEGGGG